MAKKLYIGTSGWSYSHWKEIFYPVDLPYEKRLEFYSKHFATSEVNSSFYHLPQEKTIITDSKTVLIKQVKDGAMFNNVPATFSEIKAPVQIVVYYSTNSGTEYTASKIQIMNF